MSAQLQPSWQDVLANCEATADAAQALLDSRNGIDVERFAELAAVDLWQLSLPPLPEDLIERARSVHARQLKLQADLILAMGQVHRQIQVTECAEPFDAVAHFLDRSA